MSSLQYNPITHRIHGTGIFIYIHLNFVVNVDNIPYMDPI